MSRYLDTSKTRLSLPVAARTVHGQEWGCVTREAFWVGLGAMRAASRGFDPGNAILKNPSVPSRPWHGASRASHIAARPKLLRRLRVRVITVLRYKFWRFPKRYPTINSPTISNLPTVYRRALYLRIKIN